MPLLVLQYRRTHVVRPSDGKARIGIRNEYMYNVMQCTVARLYSSQTPTDSPLKGTSDAVVLLFDHVGHDVELVVSHPASNAVALAAQLTCLQLPTPYALTCLGDSGGHIQWSISRILRARAYLYLFAFCKPSPPDYMRVISGTGRRVLALLVSFSLHMSPVSRFHPIAIRWQRTGCLASLRSAPLMFESALGAMRLPPSLVGLDLRRRYRAPMPGERSTTTMIMDHIP
jgi:hypothetical protein